MPCAINLCGVAASLQRSPCTVMTEMIRPWLRLSVCVPALALHLTICAPHAAAQAAASAPVVGAVAEANVTPDYVIGPDDVLSIVFWQEKEMSADVVVRPDGNISLPLLNDVKAAGSTPNQLRERIVAEARRYFEDANAAVLVKQVNSRKVFITGQIHKPGGYPLTAVTTVVQLIATAGGLTEYANVKNIVVVRNENGRPVTYQVNYKDILALKNLAQNIELKPGDTILVP
jgi:polysaccharide export outer membrane protein